MDDEVDTAEPVSLDSEFAPTGNPPGKIKWMPARLKATGLSLVGGYQCKQSAILPVKTKIFMVAGIETTFVHVAKNEPWLLRAAGGIGPRRGGLGRTMAIETLRKKAEVAAEKNTTDATAVADRPIEYVEMADDPMKQLDEMAVMPKEKSQGKDHM